MQRTWLCCKMNCSVSLRGTQLLHIPARSAASAGSHPGSGTGGGRTPPGSISFSIVPTAEGTCLKVEPEIARLALHRGWQGCRLGRGTGTDCSSGNFPGSSCGSGRCGDGAVSMQTQPRGCGSAPLSRGVGADTGDQHRVGEDRASRGISWRRVTGITSHLS